MATCPAISGQSNEGFCSANDISGSTTLMLVPPKARPRAETGCSRYPYPVISCEKDTAVTKRKADVATRRFAKPHTLG